MNRESLLMVARQVSPLNAQKYLLAKKWKLVIKNPRQDILLFNHRSDKFKQIIIPKSNDYELYSSDLLRAVSLLAQEEQRDAAAILGQMTMPDADILRYRIRSPQADTGTLTLSSIQTLISSVIASLSAAVCDVFSPGKLHHGVTKTKPVKKLLEKAQFGQTEHGSYVVKVIAPLDNLEETHPSFQETSDGGTRLGIEHLMKSLTQVVKTVERGNTKQFIKRGLASPPFSDNLINAIVDMQLWQDADIEISSEWAPVLPPEKKIPSTVFIPSNYFDDIAKIGQGFAPKISESPVEFFSGFVIELCGETDDKSLKYGDVVVQLTRSDGESFPATVFLSQTAHQNAIKAYENNLPIHFSGRLIRESGRKKRVRDVGFFGLCEGEQI